VSRFNKSTRCLILSMMLSVFIVSVGCESTGPKTSSETSITPIDPTTPPGYLELATVQNERVGKISTYWARSAFKLEWTEDDESHTEIGEGHLIFSLPNEVALSFGKVGETFLWVGSNDKLFWLFEGGDEAAAYVGRNENALHPLCERLPITVHPLDLLDLMGLFPLPDPLAAPPAVQPDVQYNAWFVVVPGRGADRRVYFEPENFFPIRIELLEPDTNEILIAADLSEYVRMDIKGLSIGTQPDIPEWIVVEDRLSNTSLRLALRKPADRPPSRDAINTAVFNYDTVRKKMRPKEQIVLDTQCPNPAFKP